MPVEFAASQQVFEVVYYVLSADYNLYVDVRQAINLAILRRLPEEQIDLAYPTHTVYLQREASSRGT